MVDPYGAGEIEVDEADNVEEDKEELARSRYSVSWYDGNLIIWHLGIQVAVSYREVIFFYGSTTLP